MSNRHRVAVIADDLTGAMDTGLQFAKQTLDTVVIMDATQSVAAQVVVYSTESRELPATEAVKRVHAIVSPLADRLLYKKVDSTMRGNVGYELRALIGARAPRAVVVAPAFPRGGRTTRWGYQEVDGQPLEMTEFRHDPRWPMRESHLPTLLMQQSGLEVGLIGYDAVDRGREAIAKTLQQEKRPIVVVDALCERHLCHIAAALWELGSDWIPCGSAGLAEHWSRGISPRSAADESRDSTGLAGALLFVSGSRNPVTVRQLQKLLDDGLTHVQIDAKRTYDADREIERVSDAILAALHRGQDAVLEASTIPLVPGAGPRISRILAEASRRAMAECDLGGLFMTGGDVAVSVCSRLQVSALRILDEIQPGLPGGPLVGGLCDGLLVATKAGGFGDEDALIEARKWLHKRMNGVTEICPTAHLTRIEKERIDKEKR